MSWQTILQLSDELHFVVTWICRGSSNLRRVWVLSVYLILWGSTSLRVLSNLILSVSVSRGLLKLQCMLCFWRGLIQWCKSNLRGTKNLRWIMSSQGRLIQWRLSNLRGGWIMISWWDSIQWGSTNLGRVVIRHGLSMLQSVANDDSEVEMVMVWGREKWL